jgi:hypothetical protein
VPSHVQLVTVEISDKHKQVHRPAGAVGDQRTGVIPRIEACNHIDPVADHLCTGVAAMEARELVRGSGKRLMPIHIKLQGTIGAHSVSGIHRVQEVSLQLGRELARVCLHAGRRQP